MYYLVLTVVEQYRKLNFKKKKYQHRTRWQWWINEWMKWLTSAGSSNESQIAELGHLVLHDGRVIAELATVVLVVTGADGDHGAVRDLSECHDAEGHRQRFVRTPVRRQGRAQEVRTARLDQLALMVHHALERAYWMRWMRVRVMVMVVVVTRMSSRACMAFRHQNFRRHWKSLFFLTVFIFKCFKFTFFLFKLNLFWKSLVFCHLKIHFYCSFNVEEEDMTLTMLKSLLWIIPAFNNKSSKNISIVSFGFVQFINVYELICWFCFCFQDPNRCSCPAGNTVNIPRKYTRDMHQHTQSTMTPNQFTSTVSSLAIHKTLSIQLNSIEKQWH